MLIVILDSEKLACERNRDVVWLLRKWLREKMFMEICIVIIIQLNQLQEMQSLFICIS